MTDDCPYQKGENVFCNNRLSDNYNKVCPQESKSNPSVCPKNERCDICATFASCDFNGEMTRWRRDGYSCKKFIPTN